jgi:mono/diheme cytochrome c family protein
MASKRVRWIAFGSGGLLVIILAAAVAPLLVRSYWSWRASNPVRRGVELARSMGCFSCHGSLGVQGIPDPGLDDGEVPPWSGGVWMMYVRDESEIHEFILDGVSRRRAESGSARLERERAEIQMPAYRDFLRKRDLHDLTAAFLILSGMRRPPSESEEARGLEVAQRWACFSCHGPGGSGGLPNPGSFVGFVPGWYGPDFRDLVRSREEFDTWIREGGIPRLLDHPVASRFVMRQRIQMPAYRELSTEDLDALWAYAQWLARTEGGWNIEP